MSADRIPDVAVGNLDISRDSNPKSAAAARLPKALQVFNARACAGVLGPKIVSQRFAWKLIIEIQRQTVPASKAQC